MGVYFYVDGGREPNANTVGYRPLTTLTTVNDQSGNGYNFTQHSGTFTNVGLVGCYYLTNPAYLDLSSADNIPYGSANRTISIRARPTSVGSSSSIFFSYGGTSTGNYVGLSLTTGKYFNCSIWSTTASTDVIAYNTWYLLTFVVENGDFYFYVNGDFIGGGSGVSTYKISSSYILRLGRRNDAVDASTQYYGYLSELIIENVAWSQNKIRSYFSANKNKYGL